MDRLETLRLVALGAALSGLVLVLWGARLLARARAAARWTGPMRPKVGRVVAAGMATVGLLLVAASVPALAETAVTVDGPSWRPWAVRATLGVVTLAIGGYAVARLVDRAELTALIRTPQLVRTPEVPGRPGGAERGANYTLEDSGVETDGRAGWVYRDRAGEWYLAVAAGPDQVATEGADMATAPGAGTRAGGRTRQRLIRLDDFTLMPTAEVSPPLYLAGSVEIRVLGPETATPDGDPRSVHPGDDGQPHLPAQRAEPGTADGTPGGALSDDRRVTGTG